MCNGGVLGGESEKKTSFQRYQYRTPTQKRSCFVECPVSVRVEGGGDKSATAMVLLWPSAKPPPSGSAAGTTVRLQSLGGPSVKEPVRSTATQSGFILLRRPGTDHFAAAHPLS